MALAGPETKLNEFLALLVTGHKGWLTKLKLEPQASFFPVVALGSISLLSSDVLLPFLQLWEFNGEKKTWSKTYKELTSVWHRPFPSIEPSFNSLHQSDRTAVWTEVFISHVQWCHQKTTILAPAIEKQWIATWLQGCWGLLKLFDRWMFLLKNPGSFRLMDVHLLTRANVITFRMEKHFDAVDTS